MKRLYDYLTVCMLLCMPLASDAQPSARADVEKDFSKVAPEVLGIQKLYAQSGSLKSLVPEKMKAGQNGYLIATTENFRKNSKALQEFIAHKESRGFKVHVATEKDWGLTKEGKGRKQADRVRAWMANNYKQLNLLYILIIDNPHPDEGMIPMAKFKPRRYKVATPDQKRDYAKYLQYKDKPRTPDGKYLLFDGSQPSDYYYADLDSNWDANGNSILAEKEDYATGKINCVADVYVGRIPLYGGDHPYSQVTDTDDILRRTIKYEQDADKTDISWRNNLFYVGGADKRFKAMQDHFLNYSGGELVTYRVSSGYGYEPTSQKWNNDVITGALNKNDPFGFTNFQEHGSWNSMAGQINNKSANTLRTDYPSYVYLGGCDVASPEHGKNVTYTLFRRIGIAAMGATRSVTGLGGDDDTHSAAEYERLYFGQSTGEAHWRLLSDYADGMKKVGASNFLMNLMGDPSVVVFPRVESKPVVVAPNMKLLRFSHQYKSQSPLGYHFTVRNTTDKERSYTIETSLLLKASVQSFTLKPNQGQRLGIAFVTAADLPVGEHRAHFKVTSGDVSVTRNLLVNIYARTTLLSLDLDTPDARKIVKFDAKGEKAEMLKKFIKDTAEQTYVTLPKGCRADLSRTKVVPGEADVTISARIKFDKTPKGKLQFFKLGKTFECFDLSIEGGKLTCIFRTVKGNADKEMEALIDTPAPEVGKWHSMVASVSRAEQKMTLWLNGKKYQTAYTPQPGQGLVFDKIRFGYGKNTQAIHIDDFNMFDYQLNEREMIALLKGYTVKQTFPRNGDLANADGVNLAWNYGGKAKDPTFVVAVASKADFSDATLHATKSTNMVIRSLEHARKYYWRVGFRIKGKNHFPWDSFITFTTAAGLESPEITIREKRLRAAEVGDSGYTENLNKIVAAQGKPKANGKPTKAELFFAKVSGPTWLRCHSDGSLTTNHGALTKGPHEFVFSVSTRYGLPKQFTVVVIAK